MLQVKTHNPSDTYHFAIRLAEMIAENTVICLSGDLGAGKTLFVQGIAQGLSSKDKVTSPTFNIMNIYKGKFDMYHFDLYRLDYPEQLEDIGFFEYASSRGVVLIEWADKFEEYVPEEHLWIHIQCSEQEEDRLITVRAAGEKYLTLLEELTRIAGTWDRYGDPSL